MEVEVKEELHCDFLIIETLFKFALYICVGMAGENLHHYKFNTTVRGADCFTLSVLSG